MSNYAKIYWLTRLDSLNVLFFTIAVISTIILLVYALVYVITAATEEWDEGERKAYEANWGWIKNSCLFVSIVCGLCATFIPTKNEALLIYAGGKTLNYVQSDTSLAKIPNQATSIVSEYMDKALKELKEESKKK
jgi:hypothetical protein